MSTVSAPPPSQSIPSQEPGPSAPAQELLFDQAAALPPKPLFSRGEPYVPTVIRLAQKLKRADESEKEDIIADYEEIQTDVPIFRKTFSLNMTKSYAKEWSLRDMQREFFQNLLDEAIRQNSSLARSRGATYNGVQVAMGERRNGRKTEEVTILHNGQYRIAEVVFTPSQTEEKCSLRFINYGSYPHGGRKMLHFGTTSKTNMANQVGKYGEGAKRSIAICVNHDISVEMTALVKETTQWTYQKWLFKDDGHEDIKGSISAVRPTQYLKRGDPDEARFEIKLLGPKRLAEQLRFDVDHFLVPRAFMVDQEAYPGGTILTDSPGVVYVHHFYVAKYKNVAFGYDFFINVHRDRNSIPYKELVRAIGAAWNTAIDRHPDTVGRRLFEYLDANANNWRDLEIKALTYLNESSRRFLAQCWREKHPGCYPQTWEKQAECLSLEGVRVSSEFHDILVVKDGNVDVRPFFCSVDSMVRMVLIMCHSGRVNSRRVDPPESWASVIGFFPFTIVFFDIDVDIMSLLYCNYQDTLYLNARLLPELINGDEVALFTFLLCKIAPKLFEDFDPLPVMVAFRAASRHKEAAQAVVDLSGGSDMDEDRAEVDDAEDDDGDEDYIPLQDQPDDVSTEEPAQTSPVANKRDREEKPLLEQWIEAPDKKRLKLQWFPPKSGDDADKE